MIHGFDWDERNSNHIARHHVIPDELEELFQKGPYIYKTWSDRFIALGQTVSGRYLMCVFERAAVSGVIRVITARDMSDPERKLFKRKVK